MDTNQPERTSQQFAVHFVAALATGVALYLGRDIFVPLALATFLSFLLTPVVRSVERFRIPRAPAVVIVVGLSAVCVGGVGWFIGVQVTDLALEVPKYRHNIIEKVRALRASTLSFSEVSESVEQIKKEISTPASKPASQPASQPATSEATDIPMSGSHVGESSLLPVAVVHVAGNVTLVHDGTDASTAEDYDKQTDGQGDDPDAPVKVQVVPPESNLAGLLGGLLGTVAHPLTVAGVAVAFTIFFLAYREDLRNRLIRLCGRAHIDLTTTALSEITSSLTRYLVAQVAVNCINGVALAGGLFLIGVPNAALWGLIGAILRFVPFIGTWIAAILPISLSIAVFEGWTLPLVVVGWILVVDMLSVNVLEPLLYGAGTGISPTAILVSAVFWTWLWGGIGLFLATPITVCLAVLGKYVPQLEVLYVLLSDRPALEPHLRFYQRLLAHDRDEARKIVHQAVQSMEPREVADRILAPALKQIEANRRAGTMDADQHAFARELVIELLDMVKPKVDLEKS